MIEIVKIKYLCYFKYIKMNFYKINRWIHREFGFFFVGVTIIYAISGIAINHINDWNPNYSIIQKNIKTPPINTKVTKIKAKKILSNFVDAELFKNFYYPEQNILKIFFSNGSLTINTNTGVGYYEEIKQRPILYQMNKLHYNPNIWWTVFSDIFAVSLFIIAITGLFINKGKYGIKGRGGILLTLGIIIPILFILFG